MVELVDLPEEGLVAGAVGAIINKYSHSDTYEDEFADNDGRIIALVASCLGQLRLIC